MVEVDKDFYIVWDRIADHPYLAWVDNGAFYADGYSGPWMIDRIIVSFKPVIFPNLQDLEGWKLSYQEKPYIKGIYDCSDTVLAYDSRKNKIYESFWCNGEWCDAESMGGYDPKQFDPNFWKLLPTITEMEKLVPIDKSKT